MHGKCISRSSASVSPLYHFSINMGKERSRASFDCTHSNNNQCNFILILIKNSLDAFQLLWYSNWQMTVSQFCNTSAKWIIKPIYLWLYVRLNVSHSHSSYVFVMQPSDLSIRFVQFVDVCAKNRIITTWIPISIRLFTYDYASLWGPATDK